jgi:Ni/Co efflux regulator RcnB
VVDTVAIQKELEEAQAKAAAAEKAREEAEAAAAAAEKARLEAEAARKQKEKAEAAEAAARRKKALEEEQARKDYQNKQNWEVGDTLTVTGTNTKYVITKISKIEGKDPVIHVKEKGKSLAVERILKQKVTKDPPPASPPPKGLPPAKGTPPATPPKPPVPDALPKGPPAGASAEIRAPEGFTKVDKIPTDILKISSLIPSAKNINTASKRPIFITQANERIQITAVQGGNVIGMYIDEDGNVISGKPRFELPLTSINTSGLTLFTKSTAGGSRRGLFTRKRLN